MTVTKTVKIIVKAQKFEGVKPVVKDETPITIKVPAVEKSIVTSAGIMSITFD